MAFRLPCRPWPALALALVLPLLAACVPAQPGTAPAAPALRWSAQPQADSWTSATLSALAARDAALAGAVPGDIADWCPAYPGADLAARRVFWAGLISLLAERESRFNEAILGGGGRYVGLMQISSRSAANYGCTATTREALQEGTANLSCAVTLLADEVARDGVVAGAGNRGAGRNWMPLRKAGERAEMQAWTRAQPWCARG